MTRNATERNLVQQPVLCAIEPLEERRLMSTVVALESNTLFFFNSATPGQTLAKVKVRGLARRESLVGIDYRPATGQLYGVGSGSHLYTINPSTGVATDVDSTGAAFAPPLAGTNFGVDFDPVADQLRVTSDVDTNFRLDPTTGAVVDFDLITAGTQTDLALAYASTDAHVGANPNVASIAYGNGTSGSTTAYGIDSDIDSLVTVGSVGGTPDAASSGTLNTVGSLNVDAVSTVGFDVDTSGGGDVGYASIATNAKRASSLYTVDLTTGASTLVGAIKASKRPVTDIAVVPTGNTVLAIDAKNRLFKFDSNLPLVATVLKVNGLARKEKLVAIDARPATGGVYAFTNQNRLYTIDSTSGLATTVGGQTAVALNKKALVGMDFNPVDDQARIIDTAGENLRIDPVTGQIIDSDLVTADVQLDSPIAYASTDTNAGRKTDVSAIAFSNNIAISSSTTLYAIDAAQDTLVTVGTAGGATSPATGELFTVGSLGLDVRDPADLDIVTIGSTDTAYAVFRARGQKASLYQVNLGTGAATAVALLAKGVSPISMTVLPAAS